MASPVMLAIDVVLGALIGPPGCAAETVIERAEAGEWTPIVLDLALYCAFSSVHDDDRVDHARFARLMRHAVVDTVTGRDGPLSPPSDDEIAHWRDVVFGNDEPRSCCG